MTAERQYAPLWLRSDKLTDEDMEAVPGHEAPCFQGKFELVNLWLTKRTP